MPKPKSQFSYPPQPTQEPIEEADNSYKWYILAGCVFTGTIGWTVGGGFGIVLAIVSFMLGILFLAVHFQKEILF